MDFLVPKLSATMESATVLRWLKQAGQRVRMGEPLCFFRHGRAKSRPSTSACSEQALPS